MLFTLCSIAQDAVLRMVNLLGKESFEVECVEGVRIVIREKPMDEANEPRILCMECGNMMSVPDIEKADIVMLETDVPQVSKNISASADNWAQVMCWAM